MNSLWKTPFAVAALSLLTLSVTTFAAESPTGTFDVRAFGAKGDGTTLDTGPINNAIAAASEAGGGTVQLTAGTYLSASIHLQSNVTLDIGPGATLLAVSPKIAPYDAPEPNPSAGKFEDFGHRHWHNSLIWGDGLHDIAIVGTGRILGSGLARDTTSDAGAGNKSIALKLCRNVIIRDVTLQHAGWFGILATGVDNLTVDNLKIDTNRDGMDIDCCRNVHISNCTVNSPNDDGICLKSSFGLGFIRPTENVTITNCEVSGYDEGTLLDGTYAETGSSPIGRIKMGTEANGGFKNITISNCVFAYCRGLALEEVDGGPLEDVSISNITMRDIMNAPIYLRLGGRLRGPKDTTAMGTLKRVSISHVTVYNASSKSAVIVAGSPGFPVQDVTMSDIRIWYRGGGTAEQASRVLPEDLKGYPEPGSMGVLPAYAVYLRHVRNISMDHIKAVTLTDDMRPAFLLDDVSNAEFENIDVTRSKSGPAFVFNSVANVQLRSVAGEKDRQH